jgi:ribosomal-protein-serine acetyltransferase
MNSSALRAETAPSVAQIGFQRKDRRHHDHANPYRPDFPGRRERRDRPQTVSLRSMPVMLSDGVVTLRPLERADRDAMYAAVRESIAEVGAWLPWCHPAYAASETAAFIETTLGWWTNQSQFPFGVFDAMAGTFIGGTGVNHISQQNRYANIGYWVRTGRARQGLAPRALLLAARYAFQTLGMKRVEIAAHPDNLASRRVAEKAGATFEGVMRNRIYMRGRPYPAALYSLVPEDLGPPPLSAPAPSSPEIL